MFSCHPSFRSTLLNEISPPCQWIFHMCHLNTTSWVVSHVFLPPETTHLNHLCGFDTLDTGRKGRQVEIPDWSALIYKADQRQIFKRELDSMHCGSLFYLWDSGVLRWRRCRMQWQWVIPVVCVCQSALRGCCSTLCVSTWTSSLQVSGNTFHAHCNWLSPLWSNISSIFRVQNLEHLYMTMAQKQLRDFFFFF